MLLPPPLSPFFFFNDTATTEIYTLSLHDALPISSGGDVLYIAQSGRHCRLAVTVGSPSDYRAVALRLEEHTSELQSRPHLVCRLLLEKKKHPNRPAHYCVFEYFDALLSLNS